MYAQGLSVKTTKQIIDYEKQLQEQLQDFYATLTYLSEEDKALVEKAFDVSTQAHATQKRQSGEPYVTHPLAVAHMLAHMRMDAETLCAALLHDVLEDTSLEKKWLATHFNANVADLVDGVSKLNLMDFSSKAEAQAENYRKMLLAMTRDIRVIIVKLADRLHNMRTLMGLSAEKKQRVAKETLEIYAPIANRLGMHNIRIELEDLSFQAMYPFRYQTLHDAVFKARSLRQAALTSLQTKIEEKLAELNISTILVSARQKHLFSIYQKMRLKHLSLGEIMDIYGLRIIVESLDDCYRALGAIHNVFKPLPGKFKDYLAIPKANGYQSLHTILFGPEGMPIEIQIRTNEMDYYAENGIAAHWLYKTDESRVNVAQLKMSSWLKTLIEMQNASGNSQEFIESVKIDLFPDEVYVFTPKGRILELPGGATPVDFAYAVHTDIGDHCVGARINRRSVALSSPLSNGQTVEIITDPDATPKVEWLNFVATGRARSCIKHFLKEKQYDVSVALGKQLLINAMLSLGEANPNLNESRQQQLLKSYLYDKFELLLEEIGVGNESPMEVAQTLLGKKVNIPLQAAPLALRGTEGVVVKFATCCYPLPGDHIKGYLVQNEGLWVHQDCCEKMPTKNLIPLYWHARTEGLFKACVMIDMENKQGVLALLVTTVSHVGIKIQDIGIIQDDGVFSTVQLFVMVKHNAELMELIQRLKHIKAVLKVERLIN